MHGHSLWYAENARVTICARMADVWIVTLGARKGGHRNCGFGLHAARPTSGPGQARILPICAASGV
jgi:hypothetical protein